MQGTSCATASLRQSRSIGAVLMMRDGLLQAVEDIEQETGAPLDADNEDGWLKLASVAQVSQRTHQANGWHQANYR